MDTLHEWHVISLAFTILIHFSLSCKPHWSHQRFCLCHQGHHCHKKPWIGMNESVPCGFLARRISDAHARCNCCQTWNTMTMSDYVRIRTILIHFVYIIYIYIHIDSVKSTLRDVCVCVSVCVWNQSSIEDTERGLKCQFWFWLPWCFHAVDLSLTSFLLASIQLQEEVSTGMTLILQNHDLETFEKASGSSSNPFVTQVLLQRGCSPAADSSISVEAKDGWSQRPCVHRAAGRISAGKKRILVAGMTNPAWLVFDGLLSTGWI